MARKWAAWVSNIINEGEVNMNKKFFPELARRLRQEGVATGPAEENQLPVLLNGQG